MLNVETMKGEGMLDNSFDLVFSYELPLAEECVSSIHSLASAWVVSNQYEIISKKSDSIEAVYNFVGDSPTVLELDSKIIIDFNVGSRKNVLSISFYLDSIYINKKKDAQILWKEKIFDFIEYLKLDRELYFNIFNAEDLKVIIDNKNKEMYIAVLPMTFLGILLIINFDVVTALICLPIMFFIIDWLLKKNQLKNKYVGLRKKIIKNMVV